MTKVNEMINSKFLRKEDIDDEIIVTINGCTLEDMPGDDNERRWVLHFKELPKAMTLNTTTIRVLEKAFGGDSDDWKNQRVELYVDPNVAFRGQVVGGLRLRPIRHPKAGIAVPATA
jgi:hypothetical protein